MTFINCAQIFKYHMFHISGRSKVRQDRALLMSSGVASLFAGGVQRHKGFWAEKPFELEIT